MQGYSKALQEENYAEAAKLRDQGAAGLPGWWVADNKEDPKGHLLRISTGFGRYVGYAYTPQDLAQAEVSFALTALSSMLCTYPMVNLAGMHAALHTLFSMACVYFAALSSLVVYKHGLL